MFREEIKGDTKTVTEFAFNEVSVGLGTFRIFLNSSVLEIGPSDRSFRSRSFFVNRSVLVPFLYKSFQYF